MSIEENLGFEFTNNELYSVLKVQAFKVGVYNSEGPPVPIPNTVVKLTSAENTWRAASRENRSMQTQRRPKESFRSFFKCAPLAQLVEHLTLNQGVQGSSP